LRAMVPAFVDLMFNPVIPSIVDHADYGSELLKHIKMLHRIAIFEVQNIVNDTTPSSQATFRNATASYTPSKERYCHPLCPADMGLTFDMLVKLHGENFKNLPTGINLDQNRFLFAEVRQNMSANGFKELLQKMKRDPDSDCFLVIGIATEPLTLIIARDDLRNCDFIKAQPKANIIVLEDSIECLIEEYSIDGHFTDERLTQHGKIQFAKCASNRAWLAGITKNNNHVARSLDQKAEKIITQYHEAMKKKPSALKKLQNIITFVQDLGQLHPFPDGNNRAHVLLLLNELLTCEGFPPCILEKPNHFVAYSVAELVADVQFGMETSLRFGIGPLENHVRIDQLIRHTPEAERNFNEVNQTLATALCLAKVEFPHIEALKKQLRNQHSPSAPDNIATSTTTAGPLPSAHLISAIAKGALHNRADTAPALTTIAATEITPPIQSPNGLSGP
jgi:hypothetical protein